MAVSNSVGGASGGSVALEEAFEPAAKKLTTLWMEISDVQCTLSRAVNAAQSGDALKGDLKRLDDLIFKSVETMDDLFTTVREDLKNRKVAANKPTSCLPVNALDAYLAGVAEAPTPTASREIQTEPLVQPAEPASVVKTFSLSSIGTFDLLRDLTARNKPKLEVKTEAPSQPQSKKRMRSPVSSDTSERKKREYTVTPWNEVNSRRPIAVRGDRMRLSQREYQLEFEGLETYVWLACRRSPPEVKALIQKYNDARKAARRRKSRQGASLRTEDGTDGDGDDENEGIFIVEKIVDHRFRYGKKQYFVKWDGYDTDENTWEPASKLRSEVRHVVDEYERDLAKAASRQSKGDSSSESLTSSMSASSSSMLGKRPAVKKGFGRPSDPSVLKRSVLKETAPLASATNMLKASGKIPKIQFATAFNLDDDEEDSDILKLAAGEEDNDSLDEYFDVPEKPSGKAVRFQELSPQVV